MLGRYGNGATLSLLSSLLFVAACGGHDVTDVMAKDPPPAAPAGSVDPGEQPAAPGVPLPAPPDEDDPEHASNGFAMEPPIVGCATVVDAERELVVRALSVVEDPIRTR